MKIAIAGYGSIGRYVEQTFGPYFEVALYDPPLGLGRVSDLDAADFVFICVPTPVRADGAGDTSIVEEVVARARPRRGFVCRSTLAVGTTEALAARYGKPFVYVPEYAGESPDHPYRDAANRRFFIYGGEREFAHEVRALFERAYGPGRRHVVVEPKAAEIAKYMENAFLALKVSFCNEFFDLCEAFDVSYEGVRNLWLQDERIGESHTTVTAARGYGGKCLPKDVAAICFSGRRAGAPMEILEAVARANQRHRETGAGALTAHAMAPVGANVELAGIPLRS